MRIESLFKQLAGRWMFKRKLLNSMDQSQLLVVGNATFHPLDQLQYLFKEQGKHGKIQTLQQYLYVLDIPNNLISVHSTSNKDQLLSKLFSFNAACSQSTHSCAQDLYAATFNFNAIESLGIFSIEYIVQGPRKNYKSTTIFSRYK